MDIKLIALDLDNTLLNADSQLSIRNRETLKKLHQCGLKVVLTTGRPIKGILPFIDQLNLKEVEDYSINFNGGVIQNNLSKKIISSKFLTKDMMKPINNLANQMRFPLDGITIDRAYSVIDVKKSGYQSFIGKLMAFTDVEFADLPDDQHYFKFVSQTEPPQVAEIQAETKNIPNFTIVKSRPNLLEFLPRGVNKSFGLSKLLAHFGWSFDNVMAFGDEENDLPMIKSAGIGVAMGNASAEVKAVSNAVTKRNTEDGVAVYLEKYFDL
ncbi:Cof-type HAD-IIB family hydrolase [Oenococcus sicerae]|uniref:Cof-type HAD-IIB family hydrolase n=1 Tax=Oenococcus sicerae TaxID=2203724 RepID=UPI0010B0B903|nr:Sugar phosphatase YidA [Oenococcus sicerae]